MQTERKKTMHHEGIKRNECLNSDDDEQVMYLQDDMTDPKQRQLNDIRRDQHEEISQT